MHGLLLLSILRKMQTKYICFVRSKGENDGVGCDL